MSGKIYYIACSETRRLKIGYTSGSVHARLNALQTGSASQLLLIACHGGSLEREREIHGQFAEQRVRGEWFEMSEALFEHICMIVWLQAKQSIILGEPIEDWVRQGLATMHSEVAPLPQDLAALI